MRKHNIVMREMGGKTINKDTNFDTINPLHGYNEDDIKKVYLLEVGESFTCEYDKLEYEITRVPSDTHDHIITAVTFDDAEDRDDATEPDWRLYVSCKCGHDASLDADEQRHHLDGFDHDMLGGLSKYTCEHCNSVLIIEDELEPSKEELLEVQKRYGIVVDCADHDTLLSDATMDRINGGIEKFDITKKSPQCKHFAKPMSEVTKKLVDESMNKAVSNYIGAWVHCGDSPKFFCYLEKEYEVGAIVQPKFPIESVRSIVAFYSSDDGLIIDFVDDDRLYIDQFDTETVTVTTPNRIPITGEHLVVDVWAFKQDWIWIVVDDSETWLRLESPCCDGAYVESWQTTNLLTTGKVFDFEQTRYTVYRCSNCTRNIDLKKMRNKKFVPVVSGQHL